VFAFNAVSRHQRDRFDGRPRPLADQHHERLLHRIGANERAVKIYVKWWFHPAFGD